MLRRFFFLTFFISWIVTVTISLQVHGLIAVTVFPPWVSWLAGLIPAIVAISLVQDKKAFLQSYVNRGFTSLDLLLVFLLTFGFLGVTYAVHLLVNDPISLYADPFPLLIQACIWFILAAGEELGWRGYALPKLLERFSLFQSTVILGAIWCVWHYPKILGSPYLKTWEQVIVGLSTFSIQIFAGNIIICWLYARGNKSIWLTTIYHTMWNVVCTLYFFMAMDNYVTILICSLSIIILVMNRDLFFSRRMIVETKLAETLR